MAHNLLYEPLDESRREIRLVTILPSENEDQPVACRLETASLTDKLEYVAMSYVWGDPSVTKDIVVNGTVFPVTTNLEAGLWHFRKYGLVPCEDKKGEVRLWVDAICINQQDVLERNQQVARIGILYRNASFVLSWLGRPALPHELRLNILSLEDPGGGGSTEVGEDDSNGAVNYPHDLESELIQEGLKWITGQPALHHDGSTPKSSDALWSFDALVNLPYWRRVWIHQERALSKSSSRNLIRCGAELATWEDFVFFFSVLRALENNSVRPPEIHWAEWLATTSLLKTPLVTFATRLRAWWKSGRTVPYLVPVVADVSEATDPRDMIYGLRSLLNLNLEVDYEKSVKQVYLDWHAEATAQSLESGEVKVDLISRAGIGLYEENEHNLPSWLPNLCRLHEKCFLVNVNERTDIAAKIKLGTPREQYYSEDGALSVYGAVCDQVTRTSLSIDDPDSLFQTLRELGADYVSYMKEKDHPTGIRPLQALYYTVHKGMDPYTGQQFARELNPQSGAAQVFRYLCAFELPTTTTGHDWSYADLKAAGGPAAYLESRFRDCGDAADTERWRSAMADMSPDDRQTQVMGVMIKWASIHSKVVFYTARGYIGIGPRYTQVGDRLCVIDNCSLPVLLRMEDSGYRLVGAAYAYGLSETQPRETIRSGGFKLEKFEIH
ncbi:hypothetical protein DL764_010392 [Monosporascus ibericus]|uniref:Heterokaryon incompatibility domain-containing protein n=1 Tax=Monosporascus ibericus TaxID=155417 RepID=A0A4Q4SUX2_9PEZI|nr:hypothetical protein DL764_010392 [Monosporascus ibericus]